MKITVIGAGSYGIAIAHSLAKNKNNNIMMCTHNKELFDEFNRSHRFTLFKDYKVPDNISLTMSYEEALKDSSIIFFVTSAKYVIEVCNNIRDFYKNTPICIASKGIEHNSLSTLSNVVKDELNTKNIAVISGPTFAIDLISNEPCALAIGGLNRKTIKKVKEAIENDTLKLRVSSDILGIQLCGSIKNIIAIAAGILKGLGYSESTQAFLINESMHDIKKIIKLMGGKPKTILSFAGIGDLLLTCSSTKSRNYSFGYVIGSTKSKKEIDKYLHENTVEGYYTLDSVYRMLKKRNLEIPLISIIYDIVNNNKNPEDLAEFLIKKD